VKAAWCRCVQHTLPHRCSCTPFHPPANMQEPIRMRYSCSMQPNQSGPTVGAVMSGSPAHMFNKLSPALRYVLCRNPLSQHEIRCFVVKAAQQVTDLSGCDAATQPVHTYMVGSPARSTTVVQLHPFACASQHANPLNHLCERRANRSGPTVGAALHSARNIHTWLASRTQHARPMAISVPTQLKRGLACGAKRATNARTT
jgi:hypothetical protein